MNKIGYIQALRALAVTLVVGFHYEGIIPLFKHGFIGVDLFFVICGFIMVYTTKAFTFELSEVKTFLIKRFSRVWPVYAVLTLLFFLIFTPSIPGDAISQVKWIIKSILFYPSWNVMPVIKSGWTLPLEVLFYLLFALSMVAGRWRWIALSAIMIFTLGFLSSKVMLPYASFKFPGVFIATAATPINWSFYIGSLVGLLSIKNIRLNKKASGILFFLSLFVFMISLTTLEAPAHGPIIGLMFGVMVYSIDCLNADSEIKIPTNVLAVGNMSFSIYLCHEFVLAVYAKYFDQFAVSLLMKVVLFFPYVGMTLLLSWYSWKYLENGLAVWVRDYMMGKTRRRGATTSHQ